MIDRSGKPATHPGEAASRPESDPEPQLDPTLRQPSSGSASFGSDTDRHDLDGRRSTHGAGPRRGKSPRSIAHYTVLETLGEGGMGVVYLAEQTQPMRRRVAIKVIRAARADREALSRFEVERQTLARMNHPHIAQVYEASETVDGEPYIAMEYVPGMPITRYCDEHRLSIDARLDLFVLVCEAVQHAHQRGVIHRDLKPGNILVRDEQGQPLPKLIDFGIAKVLDQPGEEGLLYTGNRVLGTPAYLSPEAIQSAEWGLDLDTRTDVYSLGVLLHELLVGAQPHSVGETFLATLRRISDQDAPTPAASFARLDAEQRERAAANRGLGPTQLDKRLRGELGWIVGRAMARERQRRYTSPAELAQDLRRFREHQPVLAGPPGLAYRLRKLARRHTAATIGSLLVAVAVLGGLVARTIEAERANREAERANWEAAEARRASDEATELSRFLISLFEAPEPNSELTVPELLDRGTERARRELADQPLIQARLLETVGIIDRKLGLYDRAEEVLAEALATRRRELGTDHLDTASTQAELVTLYWLTGRFAEAEPLAEQTLAAREAALPADHPDVARSVEALALLYRRLGKLTEAEPLLLRSIPTLEKSVGPDHPDLATALNALGIHYWNRGRFEEAASYLQRALGSWERARGPDHPEVAATLNNLAGVYRDQSRFAEAEPLYDRALEIRRTTLGEDHPSIGYSYVNLAQLRRKQGRSAEGEVLYRQALAVWESSLGPDHPDVAFALNNLALTLAELDRVEEGEVLSRRAMRIIQARLGAEHPSVAATLSIQARLAEQAGRFAEARELHQTSVDLYQRVREPEHPSLAWALQGLANSYRDHGPAEQAGPLYERALAIRRAALGPEHPETRELEADQRRWREGAGH